jgi:hypothetical protein
MSQADTFVHLHLDRPIFYTDIDTIVRENILLKLENTFVVMNTRYCQFSYNLSSLMFMVPYIMVMNMFN